MRKADSMCDEIWTSLFLFPDFLSEEKSYFIDGILSCHISIFVYTFCMLFDSSQKSNMTLQDFPTHSLLIASHNNYFCVAYFGNDKKNSVSI